MKIVALVCIISLALVFEACAYPRPQRASQPVAVQNNPSNGHNNVRATRPRPSVSGKAHWSPSVPHPCPYGLWCNHG